MFKFVFFIKKLAFLDFILYFALLPSFFSSMVPNYLAAFGLVSMHSLGVTVEYIQENVYLNLFSLCDVMEEELLVKFSLTLVADSIQSSYFEFIYSVI